MSKFVKYLDESLIFEMATLGPKDHNFGIDIKLHILQPGDKQLHHGARIKCIKPNVSENFSITLNEDPDKISLIGSYKELISTKEVNHLIDMVKFYRIPFLNMWYNSEMSFDELKSEMEQIDKGFTVDLRRNNVKTTS